MNKAKLIFLIQPEVGGFKVSSYLEYQKDTTMYCHGVFSDSMYELGDSIHERMNKLRDAGIDATF